MAKYKFINAKIGEDEYIIQPPDRNDPADVKRWNDAMGVVRTQSEETRQRDAYNAQIRKTIAQQTADVNNRIKDPVARQIMYEYNAIGRPVEQQAPKRTFLSENATPLNGTTNDTPYVNDEPPAGMAKYKFINAKIGEDEYLIQPPDRSDPADVKRWNDAMGVVRTQSEETRQRDAYNAQIRKTIAQQTADVNNRIKDPVARQIMYEYNAIGRPVEQKLPQRSFLSGNAVPLGEAEEPKPPDEPPARASYSGWTKRNGEWVPGSIAIDDAMRESANFSGKPRSWFPPGDPQGLWATWLPTKTAEMRVPSQDPDRPFDVVPVYGSQYAQYVKATESLRQKTTELLQQRRDLLQDFVPDDQKDAHQAKLNEIGDEIRSNLEQMRQIGSQIIADSSDQPKTPAQAVDAARAKAKQVHAATLQGPTHNSYAAWTAGQRGAGKVEAKREESRMVQQFDLGKILYGEIWNDTREARAGLPESERRAMAKIDALKSQAGKSMTYKDAHDRMLKIADDMASDRPYENPEDKHEYERARSIYDEARKKGFQAQTSGGMVDNLTAEQWKVIEDDAATRLNTLKGSGRPAPSQTGRPGQTQGPAPMKTGPVPIPTPAPTPQSPEEQIDALLGGTAAGQTKTADAMRNTRNLPKPPNEARSQASLESMKELSDAEKAAPEGEYKRVLRELLNGKDPNDIDVDLPKLSSGQRVFLQAWLEKNGYRNAKADRPSSGV